MMVFHGKVTCFLLLTLQENIQYLIFMTSTQPVVKGGVDGSWFIDFSLVFPRLSVAS